MTGSELDQPVEPGGLIVMVRPEPVDVARLLASNLHAELAIGGPATERALRRLLAQRSAPADLDALHAAMRRAEDIRDRTRSEAARRLASRLNTTLAIHPATFRSAAERLLDAEEAVRAATARRSRRRSLRLLTRAGGLGVAIAGIVVAVVGHLPVGAALGTAGLVLSATTFLPAGRRPDAELAELQQNRRFALAAWEQLAGTGADPHDLESVCRRYDPQHQVVASLLTENPAVRAADRMAAERRKAWVAAWIAEVGDHIEPPLATLHEVLTDERTELLLSSVEPTFLHGPDTLVVVEPYTELDDAAARRLHGQLLALPREQRVIVLLSDGSQAAGAHQPDSLLRAGPVD